MDAYYRGIGSGLATKSRNEGKISRKGEFQNCGRGNAGRVWGMRGPVSQLSPISRVPSPEAVVKIDQYFQNCQMFLSILQNIFVKIPKFVGEERPEGVPRHFRGRDRGPDWQLSPAQD